MPLQLDDYDVSILKSLLKDGRKSFRKVSRETGITTPTVKARFTRLVNVGFIKSVSPILDFNILENESILKPELEKEQNKGTNPIENKKKNTKLGFNLQQLDIKFKIKKGLKIKLDCEFCKGLISAHPSTCLQICKF
jgi:DNA-binding Lrp family transcriptional regulator